MIDESQQLDGERERHQMVRTIQAAEPWEQPEIQR